MKILSSIQCARCPKEEQTELTLEQAIARAKDPKVGPPALTVYIDGEKVASFDHLCAACRTSVGNYLNGAVRTNEKRSALRVRKQKEKAAATQGRSTPPPLSKS